MLVKLGNRKLGKSDSFDLSEPGFTDGLVNVVLPNLDNVANFHRSIFFGGVTKGLGFFFAFDKGN